MHSARPRKMQSAKVRMDSSRFFRGTVLNALTTAPERTVPDKSCSQKKAGILRVVAFLLLVSAWGVPQAAWGESAYRTEPRVADSGFERSVDLKRFRSGNGEWDTQELVASGMTQLHRDHEQILRELAEIKAALERLEKK